MEELKVSGGLLKKSVIFSSINRARLPVFDFLLLLGLGGMILRRIK